MSRNGLTLAAIMLPAVLLLTSNIGAMEPPLIAPSRVLDPHVADLALQLRDLCTAGHQIHSETAESLKVELMLALHPDTPNLESLVGGAWPYEWEGLECEPAHVTAPDASDMIGRLYYAGRERSITLYLFEWSSGEARLHELEASELGIHNALFLLGDVEVLDLFASMTDTTSNPFPVLMDLNGDSRQEIILHGLTAGFPSEGEEGALYWPTPYRWENGSLINVADSSASFYYDFVTPLYEGVVEELRSEWKAVGKPGDHPLAAMVDSLLMVRGGTE